MAISLCEGAASGRFTAQHNSQQKIFNSPNTPLVQEDYQHLIEFSATVGGVSSGVRTPQQITLFTIPNASTGSYRLRSVQTYNSGVIDLHCGSQYLGRFTGTDYNPQKDEDRIILTSGQILYATGVLLPTGFFNNFNLSIAEYVPRWGHRVTDRAGQAQIFRTGSVTRPALYTSTCTGACGANKTPCNGCCLDCGSVSVSLASILGNLS